MYVFNSEDFPYVEFGSNPVRKIRLVMSPYTTGDERLSIVHATVPPGGISEGHIHEDSDEFICFDHDGKAVVDGVEYEVKKNGIVFAPRGVKHECINTSPVEDLKLICFFLPGLKPYGKYPELIEKTKEYLGK